MTPKQRKSILKLWNRLLTKDSEFKPYNYGEVQRLYRIRAKCKREAKRAKESL